MQGANIPCIAPVGKPLSQPMAQANRFDYVVVGAGSAGCVLAARLSEDVNTRVALIEAGGPAEDPAIADPLQWPFLGGAPYDWNFRTCAQPHTAGRVHEWPRGKVIGGTSCVNAMAHVRGHPTDFDRWVEAGCVGWGYADLLPYFIRSETGSFADSPYHGSSGPISLLTPDEPNPLTLSFMAAGEECGFAATEEHNGARLTGPTLNTLTIAGGERQSVADAYLMPALGRGNLVVLSHCQARRLKFVNGNTCHGVEISHLGKSQEVIAERSVILAAGAIGSPALLMHSGVGPAEELRAVGIRCRIDLPGVGRNLQDHLLAAGNLYAAARAVPPSRYQHSESLLYARRSDHDGAPELAVACVLLPAVTECFEAPAAGAAYCLMFGFTHPASRGAVRLASNDPDVPPLIDPAYLSALEDLAEFSAALDLARRIGGAKALGEWRGRELLPGPKVNTENERREFLQRAAHTHHHPVGTCRMGRDDQAVVGPDLKLRGAEGLYVVDASVMPTITTGPVNAAIIAIAERASDIIRDGAPLAPITSVRPD